MKSPNFLKAALIVGVAAFTFSCSKSEDSTPAPSLSVTSVTPSPATVGSLVTVVGTAMETLDSVKIGAAPVELITNTSTSCTFNVPAQAFTGKLYVYNSGKVDSSKSIEITEPTDLPTAAKITALVDGVPFEGTASASLDTLTGNNIVIVIQGVSGTKGIILTLPRGVNKNTPVNASTTNPFLYFPSISNTQDIYAATGSNGATGVFNLTASASNYLRGTFNFTAANTTSGKKIKITNGRLALK